MGSSLRGGRLGWRVVVLQLPGQGQLSHGEVPLGCVAVAVGRCGAAGLEEVEEALTEMGVHGVRMVRVHRAGVQAVGGGWVQRGRGAVGC